MEFNDLHIETTPIIIGGDFNSNPDEYVMGYMMGLPYVKKTLTIKTIYKYMKELKKVQSSTFSLLLIIDIEKT